MGEIATGALRAVGEAAVNLAGAALSKIGQVLGDSISAARESNMVAAQTAQVIKSTGSAAGVTAQHVLDYASALSAASGKSLFGDEQIAESSNLLLTFTNIKGATLDAATAISVDMAQALGGAPKDAAIQLGKALNDPIKGVTALTKVGVTFDDQQKATIQAMQEAGDTAGAQAIILAELNKEFGGSAEAAAVADGGWAQFHDRLGEVEETIGKAILPILGILVGFLNDSILPAIEAASNAFGAWLGNPATQAEIQAIGDAIQTGLAVAMEYVSTTVIPALIDAWNTIQPALGMAVSVIAELADWFQSQLPAAISIASTYWNTTLLPIFNALADLWAQHLEPALSALGVWFIANLPVAISTLVDIWTGTLQPIVAQLAEFVSTVLVPAIGVLVDWLAANLPTAIQTVADFWTNTLLPALNGVWAFIQNNVLPILNQVFTWLKTTIPPALTALAGFWTNTLLPALNGVWAFIQNNVIPILTVLVNDGIKIVGTEIRLMGELWTNVLKPALTAVWDYIDKNVLPILKVIGDAIGTTLAPIIRTISDLFASTFTKALENAKSGIGPVEKAINAVGDAIEGAIRWVQKFIDKLDDIKIPSILQQQSPSELEQSIMDVGAAAQGAADNGLPAFMTSLKNVGTAGKPIITGIMQGIQDTIPDLIGLISQTGVAIIDAHAKWSTKVKAEFVKTFSDINDQIAKLGDSINDTINDAFMGAASLDRAKARAIAALDDISEAQRKNVQDQLAQADAAAAAITDPAAAARFFKLRSDQIFELAKLQDDLAAAGDDMTRQHIADQIALITDAQQNEMAGFQQTAASNTSTIASQLAALQQQADSFFTNAGGAGLPGQLEGNATINAISHLINQLSGLQGNSNSSVTSSNSVFNYQPTITTTAPVVPVPAPHIRAMAQV